MKVAALEIGSGTKQVEGPAREGGRVAGQEAMRWTCDNEADARNALRRSPTSQRAPQEYASALLELIQHTVDQNRNNAELAESLEALLANGVEPP